MGSVLKFCAILAVFAVAVLANPIPAQVGDPTIPNSEDVSVSTAGGENVTMENSQPGSELPPDASSVSVSTDPPSDTEAASPSDTAAASPSDTAAASPSDTAAASPSDTAAASPSDTAAASASDTAAAPSSEVPPSDAPSFEGAPLDASIPVSDIKNEFSMPRSVSLDRSQAETKDKLSQVRLSYRNSDNKNSTTTAAPSKSKSSFTSPNGMGVAALMLMLIFKMFVSY